MSNPSSWDGAPLANFDLAAAFNHHSDKDVKYEDWIAPGQVQMQAKHDTIEKLLNALHMFRSPDAAGALPVYTQPKTKAQDLAPATPPSKAPAQPPVASRESYPSHVRSNPVDRPSQDQDFQPAQAAQPQAQMYAAQGALSATGYGGTPFPPQQ